MTKNLKNNHYCKIPTVDYKHIIYLISIFRRQIFYSIVCTIMTTRNNSYKQYFIYPIQNNLVNIVCEYNTIIKEYKSSYLEQFLTHNNNVIYLFIYIYYR